MPTPGLQNWLFLVILSFMWGTSFLFTKIAVTEIAPTTVVASRLALGAVVLSMAMRARGLRMPRGGRAWAHLVLLSFFGNSLPFALITWGQRAIDSGLAAMLLAGMPLATLLLAHFFVEGEKMTPRKTTGFVIGVIGIAILVGPDAVTRIGGDRTSLLSQAAIFIAALSYALNAVLARHLPAADPLIHTTATVSLAALTTLPIGFAGGLSALNGLTAWGIWSLIWLGVISTAAATILYFRIIAAVGPTFLALINYLIPPIAIIAGALVLGEKPAATSLVALTVILLGIAISQERNRVEAVQSDKGIAE